MTLKDRITKDMKTAMRAKDTPRLETIRMLRAAIQRKEVDEQVTLDDDAVLAVIGKQIKQGRDSIEQFRAGNREDLAEKEQVSVDILSEYLPEPLSDDELDALIRDAIAATGASTMKDMGKVMGELKPRVQGRADMGQVSARIKSLLG
ncbi:MAG: GatB/YqeY domain-containing protein [Gammaproteobacteria bacterium]|nr:GatB/YqeY domain-containing protein [Gammaproteobacteria bacterium]